jgi:membrane-bound lytic murein transglycosylase B
MTAYMPSAFLQYAVDDNGDGRKNIWSDEADVWASIANYLHRNNWRKGAGWGSQVEVAGPIDFEAMKPVDPAEGCRALRYHTELLSPQEWTSKGVRFDTARLTGPSYAMVIPDANDTQHWLVGGNFRAILSYNCANKYAVSVGLLADRIIAD